ncbi:hypothetical protein FRC09_000987 [Ceratobasidium sp. 395]|nr:hypothetical protein FRC09_000987 [Ceratobasidium sp. 395]
MDLAFHTGPELSHFDFIKEWQVASGLLATSIKRYVNVSRLLRDIYPRLNHVVDNTSSVWNLFNNMDNELTLLDFYQSELHQVRAEVGQARNRSPRLAPIMVLPRELLAYIFELVLLAERRDYVGLEDLDTLDPPRHPDTLSVVCKHWHQVVINTPSLWVYIDLVVSGQHKKKHYTRASRLIKRAASLPLLVRIHSPARSSSKHIQQLTDWLAPVANRIYSLDMSEGQPSKEMLSAVLKCWLEHGVPGTVKKLNLLRYSRQARNHSHRFLEGDTMTPSANCWQIGVSQQRLDEFFRPIEILKLDGLFPHWHSQAYHGLTHLKLDTGRITEAELINLLSQSPQLRTLAFNLEILNTEPLDTPVIPIRFPQLELLVLDDMEDVNVGSLLRLIAPGSGPLRLYLGINSTIPAANLAQTEELHAFIERSNITSLHLSGTKKDADTWFPQALSHFPRLRLLALNDYSLIQHDTAEYNSVCPSLRELYLFDCNIDINLLERLLRAHSIQFLRVVDSRVVGDEVLSLYTKEIQDMLSSLVPHVTCYKLVEDNYAEPYLDWDIMDF